MIHILFSRVSYLWLLFWLVTVILAGYHVLMRSFESATSFSIIPSLSGIKLANMSKSIELSWHAPMSSRINDLSSAINDTGTYGFVFNSSSLPEGIPYGGYNWCNMPHVRRAEYPKTNSSFILEYVEIIHRHHKRTPYAANTFPVEAYPWYCDDESLFYYGARLPAYGANRSTSTYWSIYTSSSNPLVPKGFNGTCQFPQITRGGLDDSWQHGNDLYGVYHDLLGFLPAKYDPTLVSFRVTNNVITSQVASMIMSGMFGGEAQQSLPLLVQPASIDSLDSISGVSPRDSGFHTSFDHYFDNLSARLCHAKPLPCNTSNSSLCVTQAMADEVFRLGQYEYSYLYRDAGPRTLEYSVGRYGIWVAELAENVRHAMYGTDPETASKDTYSGIRYRHNIAHDGSISYLLSILQVETMVWPGMGSEVVFELYKGRVDGQYYIRVLWGGQTLKSSNPTLGLLDMVPVEILLAYFDGLIGQKAEKIPVLCSL